MYILEQIKIEFNVAKSNLLHKTNKFYFKTNNQQIFSKIIKFSGNLVCMVISI